MHWTAVAFVFVGGGLGSVLRYAISLGVTRFLNHQLPLATFFSNMISTALLAWVVWRLAPQLSPNGLLFLTIGFCGGFSTFSTFSLETFELLRSGQNTWAVLNVVLSVVFALLILFILSKSLK
jgi:CrcB protein